MNVTYLMLSYMVLLAGGAGALYAICIVAYTCFVQCEPSTSSTVHAMIKSCKLALPYHKLPPAHGLSSTSLLYPFIASLNPFVSKISATLSITLPSLLLL
jgi:hypothetical protein